MSNKKAGYVTCKCEHLSTHIGIIKDVNIRLEKPLMIIEELSFDMCYFVFIFICILILLYCILLPMGAVDAVTYRQVLGS